jgi:hypothetical protein
VKKLASLFASLILAILAGGCSGGGSSADYPANFRVVAGDGSVIVTWTPDPEVEYWIFYGPGEGITTTNWVASGGSVRAAATSPTVITGLTNGRTYSFTINGRKDGGPGGAGAPTQVAVPAIAGSTWYLGTALGTGTLNGVSNGTSTSGDSTVVVGSGGSIYSSIRAGDFVARTNPSAPADLNGVLYGAFGFVAVGTGGTVVYSSDATTWTAQTSGTTADLYGGTALASGIYLVGGAGGTLLSSTNGTSWVPNVSGTTSGLRSGVFGNGVFVFVGDGGTIIKSADTVNWTPATSGTTADLTGVAFAALSTTSASGETTVTNRFVAVGKSGTYLTSSDGTTWTAQTPFTTRDLTATVYGSQFVVVGKGGTIYTSADGLAWQVRTSGTTSDLNAVSRTLLGYAAVGSAGTNVSTFPR